MPGWARRGAKSQGERGKGSRCTRLPRTPSSPLPTGIAERVGEVKQRGPRGCGPLDPSPLPPLPSRPRLFSRMTEPVADLLSLLDLEPLEVNIYRGLHRDIGSGRVFGG